MLKPTQLFVLKQQYIVSILLLTTIHAPITCNEITFRAEYLTHYKRRKQLKYRMTAAQLITSSMLPAEGISSVHSEELCCNMFSHTGVVSCCLDADLDASTFLGFVADADVREVTAGLTGAELLDDKLPMSTITV